MKIKNMVMMSKNNGQYRNIRALTGNTAFSNTVNQKLNEAIIKIGATTIGTAVLTSIRNFYLVD